MKLFEKTSFVKSLKISGIISFLLILAGLAALVLSIFGVNLFNFDIDFTGGTSTQLDIGRPVDQSVQNEISVIVQEFIGVPASSVQATGLNNTEAIIKTRTMDEETLNLFNARLIEHFELEETTEINQASVSPMIGDELKRSAMLASIVAVILILLYITIRFDFRSGLSAIICLTHDLLVLLSFYIIFRIPMNMNVIAAFLTILGYSINATIIIFDRIRENEKTARKESFGDVVDRSVKQTLRRSVNTTITTLFTIVMLLIFGVPSIRTFALPITIGILCGTYSSVFLSGPVWAMLRGGGKTKKA